MADITPSPRRRRRPAIVTIVIVVFVLEVISRVVVTLIYFAEVGVFSEQVARIVQIQLQDEPTAVLGVRAVASAIFLIFYFITTIGLIRLRSWAWTAAMALIGIRLAFGLGDYLFDSPAFDLLIFSVVLVFLLNQHQVRKTYGITKEKRVAADHVKRAEQPVRR
jgi:hypothetical protein